MVGMNEIAKDFSTGNTSIYFTIDEINNLSMALNEAKKEFDKIVPELKSNRKLKRGVLAQQSNVEYLIHQSIAEHCGHLHM